MDTDETAEAILASKASSVIEIPTMQGRAYLLPDLQAMAKLWLMRKEIARLLDTSGSIHGGKGWAELVQKIEALGDCTEQTK